MSPDRLTLFDLGLALTERTGNRSPSYRQLWDLAARGSLPVERSGSRLFVRRADVDPIAVMLEMLMPNGDRNVVRPVNYGQFRWRIDMTLEQARAALAERSRNRDEGHPEAA